MNEDIDMKNAICLRYSHVFVVMARLYICKFRGQGPKIKGQGCNRIGINIYFMEL